MSRAISPRTPGLVDSDKVGAASLVASLAMGTLVCIKMLTTYDPLPGWGSDPTLHDAALGVSLSPDLQVAINAAITLLAGLVFVLTGHPAGKFPASAAGSFLLAVTLGSLLYHMAFNRSATIEDWTAGSDLIAAVCAGAACVRLDPAGSSHRALVALLAGVVVLVAIKGALQYSVEHGQTVRAYMDSREQILAANGWLPDSPSALAYERRLFQREPTGWFGLSNIFASVVGAGLVGLAGLALAANSLAARAVLWSAALLGGVMLILTLSKGGLIATAAGIGVLGALLMLRHQAHRSDSNRRITSRAWQLTPWAFVALVVAGQAVIALRGFLSTGISELSLLFRWFYVQGAARIIADNPLTGVGPAGFKDAYLIAKPPISPEDVASPHSLPWDFTSALGVGGVAMTVLWITWVWMAGRSAARSAARHDAPVREVMPGVVTNPADSHPAAGATVRLIALAAVTAVIASVWIEREATTPEIAAMKLVGMAAWIAVSLSAWGAARHAAAAIPLAAAAAVLALHAQVEMTPVWIGSSAWFMAIIGLAASGGCPSTCSHGEPVRARPRTGIPAATGYTALAVLAACVVAMAARASVLSTWSALLERSAKRALNVTRLMAAIDLAHAWRDPADRDQAIREAFDEYGAASGTPPPRPGALLEDQVRERCLQAWEQSLTDLLVAASLLPSHGPTRRAAGSLAIRLAEFGRDPRETDRFVRVALDEAGAAANAPRQRAAGLAWAATTRLALAERGVLSWETAQREALDLLTRAAQADPFNHQHAVRIARLHSAAGGSDQVRGWARRALELDRAASLDPLRRMDEPTRREMEALSGQSP